jgi:hypothetical protein
MHFSITLNLKEVTYSRINFSISLFLSSRFSGVVWSCCFHRNWTLEQERKGKRSKTQLEMEMNRRKGFTERLDEAREAFNNGSLQGTKDAHRRDKIELDQHRAYGKHIKDFIYGGLDGLITTFSVVAGVAGAQLSPSVVLILGFANLLADGVSMAVGNYLGKKS